MPQLKSRFRKKSWLLLVVPTVALTVWFYSKNSAPEDFDLTHARSPLIKNDKGQPAQLMWWRASEDPITVFHHTKADVMAEGGGKVGAEWYSLYGSDWMVDRWLKVAEVGNRTIDPRRNEYRYVKVYLVDPPPPQQMKDRFFLAKRADLMKDRRQWQPPPVEDE